MSLYLNGNPLIILIYAFIKSMDSLNLRLKSSQGVPGTSSPSASALGKGETDADGDEAPGTG